MGKYVGADPLRGIKDGYLIGWLQPKNKQALRRSLILRASSLKDMQKRIRQSRFCDVRIESILLDVNKKHRVFAVIISLKRPGIQMIDFS